MAANIEIGSIQPFDCQSDPATVAIRWKKWRRAFEFYVDGKGVKDDHQKKSLLLHSAGSDVQDLFDDMEDPGPGVLAEGAEDTAGEYQKAMRTLEANFSPQVNIPYERHLFRQLKQEESESIDQFIARLRGQANYKNCDFRDTDEQMRDQIIDKCKSSALRRKLLEKGGALTLKRVQEIARAMEAVDVQVKKMEGDMKQDVNQVRQARPKGNLCLVNRVKRLVKDVFAVDVRDISRKTKSALLEQLRAINVS
ncbi:uncharacterized protein [Ptychodera flava]|uniref:uncharacterized protein n=1 Tax=Ptychodera flava TaxID=63121 RepID=UPI00396A3829